MLVIGQAPVPKPAGVSDNAEVPSWWFPSGASPRPSMPPPSRATPPPTRSGSDPDDIQTAVVPVQPGVPSGPSAPGRGKAAPPAQLASLGLGNAKFALRLMAGALVLCVLGLGVIIWLQIAGNPGPVVLPVQAENRGKHPEVPAQPQLTDQTNGPEQEPVNANVNKADHVAVPPEQPAQPVVQAPPKLQLLVPAYFYPAGSGLQAWQQLVAASSKIKIVAIANPSNGPGDQRNLQYSPIFQAARDKGMRIVGYISTRYGDRLPHEVKLEIDRWVEFYPQIHGFFFDHQSTEAKNVGYYAVIRDHARQKIKNALIINNPGALCDEIYFAQGVSDVTCIFSSFEGFNQLSVPAQLWPYPPTRFAALTYQINDAKTMHEVIQDAIAKRIGYLYISNVRKDGNPWSQLPSYLAEEVEAVEAVNRAE